MGSQVVLLLLWTISFTVSQKIPALAQSWVADYRFELLYPNLTALPFFQGRVAFQNDDHNQVILGGYFSIQDDGRAPFILETQFIATPVQDKLVQLYMYSSQGRCWELFQHPQSIAGFQLFIPPGSTFLKNVTVDGYVVEVWNFPVYSGYNATIGVRVKDGGIVWVSNPESGVSFTFSNIQVGKIDPRYYQKPAGNCTYPNFGNDKQTKKKYEENNLSSPPSLATAFLSNWEVGPTSFKSFQGVLKGSLAIDQKAKSGYVHFEDAGVVPFVFQSTFILNQQNGTSVGYQYLTEGRCWRSPFSLDWIIDYPFVIPDNAIFVRNDTVEGQSVQIWEWSDSGIYDLAIRNDGAVVYLQYHTESYNYYFTIYQKDIVVGPVDPSYYQSPLGCVDPNTGSKKR